MLDSILNKKKEKSDYDKIEITSSGDFFMTSKNIFNNKDESLKLIENLQKIISLYKNKVVSTNPLSHSEGSVIVSTTQKIQQRRHFISVNPRRKKQI